MRKTATCPVHGEKRSAARTTQPDVQGRGPRLDPNAMPPEELVRLRKEGFGHMIGKSRMDDSPGYRRDW
jgi:hypothetical protein